MKHSWHGRITALNRIYSLKWISLTITLYLLSLTASGQEPQVNPSGKASSWYENIQVKGYVQMRYCQFFESDENFGNEQGDAMMTNHSGLYFKRIRISIKGTLGNYISYYIQPDFASTLTTDKLNSVQLKDAFIHINFWQKENLRLRVGLSKVPFGFDNMQSSSRRLAFDRADGINSAVPNERDLGLFLYYTPDKQRELFKSTGNIQQKGSGDFGMFAIGVYNGQTANVPDKNSSFHAVVRTALPFKIKNQILELGLQAYSGQYVLPKVSALAGVNPDKSYIDQRAGITAILFPKPLGIQFEYSIGRGPEFNTLTDSIEVQALHGGYLLVSWLIQSGKQFITPFVRGQYYDGGKKQELDARSYLVKELETGIEWQVFKQLELTASWVFSSRRYEDYILQDNLQHASLLRLQAQVNF